MKKGGDPNSKETKEFVREIIKRMEGDEDFTIPTTRFNFENQTCTFNRK